MRTAMDYLVYLVFRCAWWTAERTPLPALRGTLEYLSSVFMKFDRRRRRAIRGNLKIAFPDWSGPRLEATTRAATIYWGRLVAEIIHAAELIDDEALERVKPVASQLADLLARKRGVLLLTAHLGNFELLARMCGRTGIPLTVMHRSLGNRFVERFYTARRQAMGVGVLYRRADVRAAVRVLRDGGVLVVALDQNQRAGRGIFVDMFGRPACTSTALARLSVSCKAPVLPVFASWQGEETVPVIGKVIEPDGRGSPVEGVSDKTERIRALTALYTKEIESAVRRFPDQWNWAHRRWKTQPEPPARPAERRRALTA